MPAFEFVSDAQAPNQFSAGEFTPHADQKQYSSIWGKVDGEGTGFFDGHHIQQGIYSADGKATLKGVEYRDAKGQPHEIKHRKATLREFIVPRDAVVAWNAYEAAQGNRKEKEFRISHEAKMRARGIQPQESDITDEFVELQAATDASPATSTAVSMHVPTKRRPGRPRKSQSVS